jgi:LysR family transcriptional regulator, glycine cleavage system transcriptional activator
LKRTSPTIHELLALDAVARHESLTDAAGELCVTISAVSKQLSSLEAFVGKPLLQRQGRGVRLTLLGRQYWQKIATSLRAIETATFEMRSSDARSGLLTLASVPTFLTKWLIPRLPEFRRRAPGITLSFSQHLNGTEPIPQGVDAAIRYGSGDWPGVVADYIGGREFVLICAPSLVSQARPRKPADMANCTLLHHEQATSAWRQWAGVHDVPSAHTLSGPRFAQYSALIQAAVSGLGVGLVPRLLVQDELAQRRLITPCGQTISVDQGHYLCYAEDRLALTVFATFRAWILEQGLQVVGSLNP